MSENPDAAAEPARPLLRVVRGEPTADELAALVAVLAGRGGGGGEAPAAPPSAWADRNGALRSALPVGTGAWRATARGAAVRTRADW